MNCARPLNAVIGFSESMCWKPSARWARPLQGICSDIHASGAHLLALINDILDLRGSMPARAN